MFETAVKEVLVCDGGKHGFWLMRYANGRAVQQLHKFYTYDLGKLGLRVEAACALEAGDGSSSRANPCNCVHWCLEQGAWLSRLVIST